jgi:hypothetical protein
MSESDMEYSKGVDAGRYSSGVTNASALVAQMRSRTVSYFVAADTGVTTNLAELVMHQVPNWSGGARITDLRMTVVTNVTAGNTTNYAVIKVQSRDDNQGNAQTVGIVNCATTNLTAFVGTQFTLTKNQLSLVAKGKLTLRHDKTGAGGLQLPAYTVLAVIEDT